VDAGSLFHIPELTTTRLRLREFTASDLDAYATMMADPVVTRYLGDGRPLDRAEAWRQMALFLGHWRLRGFGTWAVEERATGVFVGRIGCFEPEGWPGFELTYTLAQPFWGRGYATEGAQAALAFAWDTLGRNRVISLIRPENTPSIRVAERLGAILEGAVGFFGAPTLVYRHRRSPSPPT
jgi:RimJ/RimL family protein N-acetyltransferase